MFLYLGAFIIAAFAVYIHLLPRAQIPEHLTNYAAFAKDELIPPETAKSLMEVVKEFRDFPSNVDQSKAQGFKPTYEHVGEAQPIRPDGTCAHPLLFPDANKEKCIFPQRVDIGKHFILTGGLDGIKEKVSESIDRVSSFGRYTFLTELNQYPLVQSLFQSDDFQIAAKQVCPSNKQYLDTFQFNFIMQVPGQTVAVHLDSPYFWGASRFHFPQWLLVAMVFSNLFADQFIHQLQVVGYLHDWSDRSKPSTDNKTKKDDQADGGEFVYYTNAGKIGIVSPLSRSGTFVDGSKVLHAAKIYQSHQKAPHLPKDQDCKLQYLHNEEWNVQCNHQIVQNYTTSDLRIAIVYRARCFSNETEAQFYTQYMNDPNQIMSLDTILTTFKHDLITNKGYSAKRIDSLNGLELGSLIMDTYIQYPLPPKELAWFPYNYCAVSLLVPWLGPLLEYIC
jgi:hypothetical protein